MRLARRNQGLIVTPFTLAGAMAPVTMAGAVAQSIAEGLSAIALAQYINPGVGCAIGTFTSNVDMKSGAPAFGTPEYIRATQMTGQLARSTSSIEVIWVCTANVPDGQSIWETSTPMGCRTIRIKYNISCCWLVERPYCKSEKFIWIVKLYSKSRGIWTEEIHATDTDGIAISAIKEVGSNGHFLVLNIHKAVMKVLLSALLSDWKNYEAWEHRRYGRLNVHTNYRQVLHEFAEPFIDQGIEEELGEFDRRKVRVVPQLILIFFRF